MKKTFRTILAGALAFLTVSCYDDTALRQDIKDLDKRVTDIEKALNAEVGGINNLATRLAAAEDALKAANTAIAGANSAITAANSQITSILTRLDAIDGATDGKIANLEAAIKALQDADKTFATSAALADAVAKIAVVNVAEKDGNVVLTLANGETVSLSKPLSNVANTGLVTITADNMWAVVEADGTVKSLDVPVGHPDVTIEFVVEENGELMYSVNGGEPQSTGVTTSDLSGQKYLITDVKESEDGKIVAISIGDATYYLPLYNPVPAVQIKSGKQFFAAGETKTVSVGIENVANLLVMNQPYGWKANISGTTLTVTAPAEANADAEKEGVIVLHGDANGACVTAVLNVVLGKGLQLSVSENGSVTITNPIVVTTTNWFGEEMTGFVDYAIGFVETSIFESFATPGEFYTAMLNDYEGNYGAATYANNVGLNLEYNDTTTVSVSTIKLSELGSYCWPSVEVVKGERYVVWALPQFSDTPDPTEMVYAYYEPIEVEIKETISFNEISLEMALYGAQSAYVGAVSEMDVLQTGAPDFKTYMEVGYGYGGPWKQFTSGGYFEALGMPVSSGDSVSVAELVYGCTPSTKYYVYVVPVQEAKSPAEYVYEKDCRVYEFTTSALVEGAEEAELTFNAEKTDFSSITVDVTVPEGATAYAKFYEVGATSEMTDAQLIADILSMGSTTLETSGSAKESYLSDGQSMVLVVLTVTEDGKYAIAKDTFSTKKFNIVDTITVTPESIVKGEDGKYTAVFAVTGASKVVVYYNYSASYSSFNKYLMQKSSTFVYADVVDGKATVTGLPKSGTANDNYFLVYSAFNEDAAGAVTEFAKSAGVQISTLLK